MKLMTNKAKIYLLRAPEDETGSGTGDDTVPAGDDTIPAGDDTVATGDDTVTTGNDTIPEGFDLEMVPSDFVKDGKPDFQGFFAKFDELASEKAIRDEAAGDVPENAEGYEFSVSDDIDYGDLELPDGFKFEVADDDPVFKALYAKAGEVMHKHNLPKEAASDFMGIIAHMKATEYSAAYSQNVKEFEALGNPDQRIANVERVLDSKLPPKLAEAAKMMTVSADGIRALEKLLAPRGLNTPPPEPADTGDTSEEAVKSSRYPTSV